jgi:hypothetical protein
MRTARHADQRRQLCSRALTISGGKRLDHLAEAIGDRVVRSWDLHRPTRRYRGSAEETR